MAFPETVTQYQFRVDGFGLVGKASVKMPQLTQKAIDLTLGGLAADIKVFTGKLEPIELEFTLHEYNVGVLQAFGIEDNGGISANLRASANNQRGGSKQIIYDVNGVFYSYAPTDLDGEKHSTLECKIHCRNLYRLSVGGVVVHHIEPEAFKHIVGGKDILKKVREDILGIGGSGIDGSIGLNVG